MLNRLFSCDKSCGHAIKQIWLHWYEPHFSASFLPQAILSSSSKDSNSHKDDGLFKAPPPPPKVIKSETIPTRLNQDIVTALKCRKEHKEVSPEHTDVFRQLRRNGGEEALSFAAKCLFHFYYICLLYYYEVISLFHTQPSCFYPFDAGYIGRGWHSLDACQAHYCLSESLCVLEAAMRTVAVNLNSPTACVIYRWAFCPHISLLATDPLR